MLLRKTRCIKKFNRTHGIESPTFYTLNHFEQQTLFPAISLHYFLLLTFSNIYMFFFSCFGRICICCYILQLFKYLYTFFPQSGGVCCAESRKPYELVLYALWMPYKVLLVVDRYLWLLSSAHCEKKRLAKANFLLCLPRLLRLTTHPQFVSPIGKTVQLASCHDVNAKLKTVIFSNLDIS